MLPTVIALSVIIGMLVFAYYQGFRHRDVQVRLSTDRASARWLARASVDVLKYAFHEATGHEKLDPPDVDGGTLLPFLLGDAATLAERVKKRVNAKADHRDFIEQLVGKDALDPIEKMAKTLPDAKVHLFIDLRASPMFTGNAAKVLSDPAFKVVDATYSVVAEVRKARESCRTTDVIDVHSLLPPGVSKFTFAALRDAGTVNSHRVTVRGQDAGGTAPVVLLHSPADGDPMTEDIFEARPAGQKKLDINVREAKEIVTATADRGFTFLPGSSEYPVNLQLASGGTPFGEYHTVYQPTGKTAFPVATVLTEQPPLIKGFHAPDPRDPTVHQSAAVQGAVFGFFEGIDQQQLLGAPPQGVMPDACSQLKPYGTGTHPSATAFVGYTNRTMAAISDIGIDRDNSNHDESDQQTAAGMRLPIRDAVDPFLRNIMGSDYGLDIRNEASGTPLVRLLPFTSFVQNENAVVDKDGDGVRETYVSSETPHSPFPIDTGRWRYAALFEKYDEYAQVMSKYLEFPANFSLHLAGLPLDRARALLAEIAFGKNAQSYRDWMITELRLEARDAYHQLMSKRGVRPYYLDTKEGGLAGLQEVLEAGTHGRYPAETTYVVRGQHKFEEIFMPGGQIDLQGLKVMVIREKPEDKPVLDFDREIVVKEGSGGTLICERFRARSLKNAGEREKYAPFVLQTGELVMTTKGPFEGVIVPQAIVQEKIKDYTVIRGSLAVSSMPTGLSNPLVVTYDPRNDPTGANAAIYYRAAFRRDPRIYDVEDRK